MSMGGNPRQSDLAWTVWTLVAASGVAVAAMGLAGAAGRPAGGGPAARLIAHVPIRWPRSPSSAAASPPSSSCGS